MKVAGGLSRQAGCEFATVGEILLNTSMWCIHRPSCRNLAFVVIGPTDIPVGLNISVVVRHQDGGCRAVGLGNNPEPPVMAVPIHR